MTIEKDILGIVPALQSTAIVKENMKMLKKPTSKNMLKTEVKNMLGIGIISETSKLINSI